MKAEIVAVGTEILLGDILNTNAQYLSKELAVLGIEVYHQCVVGDNPKRLEETLRTSFERSDIIITTGGLGPTKDDLTKEIACAYFGENLVEDEKALHSIQEFFKKTNRVMTENNKKQALVPENHGIILYNQNGTAPGVIIEKDNKIMILLPGPPHEVVPMFEKQAKPYLEKKQNYTFVSKVLRVANVGESAMEDMVIDLIEAQTNPTIAPYAKGGEAILRVTAKAKNEAEAEALLQPTISELRNRLGDSVYAEGETSMEEVVVSLLREKNLKIATAESCTGGLLMEHFVRCSGASCVVLEGCVTYSNEAKINRLGVQKETLDTYGAVSMEVAKEMAEGIAKTAGSDIGISTTGIAGPDGGTLEKPVGLVYIGISYQGKTEVRELRYTGNRNVIRKKACYFALDFLRKIL